MEMVVEIVGYKCFKGTIDGKPIDSGSLFALVRMDERFNRKDSDSTNWKGGHFVEEWKCPNHDVVMRMAHLKPTIKNPVPVRLDIERVSNGKETTEIVMDAVPVHGNVIDQKTGEIHQPAAAQAQPIKKAA